MLAVGQTFEVSLEDLDAFDRHFFEICRIDDEALELDWSMKGVPELAQGISRRPSSPTPNVACRTPFASYSYSKE